MNSSKLAPTPFAFSAYWQLMRFNKPIGTLLLLWPTLWALCLASDGLPPAKIASVFIFGLVLMRAAGCVINDIADRKIDGRVKRTKQRPLVTGAVSTKSAVALFVGLCLSAFALVLLTNTLTIALSFGGVALAFTYPFMKRHTHLPQIVLGAAFAWGVPMAFAATNNTIDPRSWLIYTVVVLWTVVYDTFYAMVDRDDDLKIGVKSTAILFGENDRVITATLQVMVVLGLVMIGREFGLGFYFDLSIIASAGLFTWQQNLIKTRQPDLCFKAFLNNNWVGACVFMGIALDQILG